MLNDIITGKKELFAAGVNTELRAQKNLTRNVTLLNGNLVGNVRNETAGVSCRVYQNGVYGFSSTAELSDDAVRAVIKAASENAEFMSEHAGKGKGMLPHLDSGNSRTVYELCDTEQKTYIEFAKEIDAYISSKYPDLLSRGVSVRADSMEKLIAVSDGFDSHSVMPRSYIYVFLTAETPDGKPIEMYEVFGKGATFDRNFSSPADLYERIDRLYRRLKEKCEGVYAVAGEKPLSSAAFSPECWLTRLSVIQLRLTLSSEARSRRTLSADASRQSLSHLSTTRTPHSESRFRSPSTQTTREQRQRTRSSSATASLPAI